MSKRGVKYSSPSELPPRYREQALQQLSQTPAKKTSTEPTQPSKKLIDERVTKATTEKLNQTEQKYLQILRAQYVGPIRIQDMTIRLGDNLRYTPDFFTDDDLTFHEVKGGYIREDARVKLLAAVRMYPCFRWILAQKTKGGWEITELKP